MTLLINLSHFLPFSFKFVCARIRMVRKSILEGQRVLMPKQK